MPRAVAPFGPPPTAEEPRAPLPFRRPGLQTVVVHAAGFEGQRDLLAFASVMERASAFSEVSLTRVTSTEAWFAVSALSPEDVAATIATFDGFEVHSRIDQNLVETRISPVSSAPQYQPPARLPSNEGEALLPPRPRFRVFRPASAESPPPATSTTPLPPLPEPHVAQVPPQPTPRAPQPPAPALPASVAPTPAVPPRAPADTRRPVSPPTAPAVHDTSNVPPAPTARPGVEATASAAPLPRREPVRAPIERDEPDDMVDPDDRPGGAVSAQEHLTLVVYPFHSFAALNDFQAAVRQLHGVKNTRVRRFYRGTLHLALDYEDIIPLGERLRDLKGFAFEVASETRSEIELVLEESGSLVAAGDK